MTTYAELKAWVQNAVGDADGTLILAADLMRYANAAQRQVVHRLRLLNKTIVGPQTLTTFDLYGGILMPTDFLIEDEVMYAYGGADLVRLSRIPWDTYWADGIPSAGTAGQPTGYTLSDYLTGAQNGQRHMLFYPYLPTGLTNQVVRISYNALPVAITSDADTLQIPDHFLELVTWLMQRSCRLQLDDFVGAQSLQRMYEQRVVELTSELNESSGLRNRVLVSESDPLSLTMEW